MKISASFLGSKAIGKTLINLNVTDVDYIHVDVMDGIFVSQKTFNIKEIRTISQVSDKKLDVHLMVENPLLYIENIKDLTNIEYITIHLEINKDIKEIFGEQEIKKVISENLVDLLIELGAAQSKREAREFLSNNAITLDGEIINDENYIITNNKKNHIIRRGKKKYYLIKIN